MLAVWVHITRGKLLMFHIAESTPNTIWSADAWQL